eukprot:26572_1
MPTSVDYSWGEDNRSVSIKVKLRGISKATVAQNLTVTDLFLNFNAHPRLLQIDFYQAIDPDSCQAVVSKSNVLIILNKAQPGIWGSLKADGSKHEIEGRRTQSMARAYARELAKKEKEKNIKKQNDRKALEALWDIQKDERKLHEKLKSETKERAR